MMAALREGRTLRSFAVRTARFEAYCGAHPEYAREAKPLVAANLKAADYRKGEPRRAKTHCVNGHLLAENARFAICKGSNTRQCRICDAARARRGCRRRRNAAVRDQNNDYYKILAMLPANLPEKDAIVSLIFEDLLNGSLQREDVGARLKHYIAAQNGMFPTKYRKFGGRPLVSLDEQLFDDGLMTRGDTITRGLWD